MRLLLAEDEEDLNKAPGAVLKHNNYSVDAVYNGHGCCQHNCAQHCSVYF